MAPSFRSSATATGTAVSAAVSTPAGVVAGDCLVLYAKWWDDEIGSTPTFVPPTGFTVQGAGTSWNRTGSTDGWIRVATKVADGTEGSTLTSTFTPSTGIVSLNWTLYALAFQGLGSTAVATTVAQGSYPTNGTSLVLPSITMPGAGGLIALLVAAPSPTLPAGMTSIANTTSFRVAYEVRASGATGTRTTTFGANPDAGAVMIGLAPPPQLASATLTGSGSLTASGRVYRDGDAPEAVVLFETTPGVWLDVSADLRAGSVSRGRQRELDLYATGRCGLTLSNADRKYDPTYAASPLAGYLKPMHRIAVQAFYNGVTYPIFHGYIDSISETRIGPRDSVATIMASDAFKVLVKATMSGRSFVSHLSGTRINALLDLAAFPAGLRDIDAGLVTLQAGTYESTLLSHAQTVSQTEFGDLYVAADGTIRFLQRDATLNLPSLATFGDGPGEIGYRSLTPQFDDTLIRNPVSIDRIGGIKQTVEDTALSSPPPTGYGINHYELSGLYHNTDAASLDAAQYILLRYKEPTRRIVGMELGPAAPDQAALLYPQMLGRELADRILIRERPQAVGDVISQDSAIEGIGHTFSPKVWTTRWNLSPGFNAGSFWQIGVPGHSEIGTTTKVYL